MIKNDLTIKGKCKYIFFLFEIVWIQLAKDGRMIGFKFVLPSSFPLVPPWTILDEPINPMVIEFIDYIGPNNVMAFAYLEQWKKATGKPE